MKKPDITLTADIIIEFEDGSILLVKRKNPPFEGMWALPGGIMDEGETIETTAIRETKEETGLDVILTGIIGVYSEPGRDPRGRYISVAFVASVTGGTLAPSSDAAECRKTTTYHDLELAFDHNNIIRDYLIFKKSGLHVTG